MQRIGKTNEILIDQNEGASFCKLVRGARYISKKSSGSFKFTEARGKKIND